MQRAKLNRGQLPQKSTDSVVARREGQLACRDCGQPSRKKHALRGGGKTPRCPKCGGVLERRDG